MYVIRYGDQYLLRCRHSRYVSGAWQERWFHMTMADARKAIRDGVAHVGVCESCEVICL